MELFLLFLFIIVIIIASFQDLKKREVDNWINFFLLTAGSSFVIFKSIFSLDWTFFLIGIFCFVFCFILANLFYYGRVFAGGDAKLLIALFPIFVSNNFMNSLSNLGLFILFLMIAGSFYGLVCSLFFYLRDFNKINNQFKKEIKNKYLLFGISFAMILIFLSFIDVLIIFFAVFIFFACILFAFAKSIEKVSMIKQVRPGELREGDWLAQEIKFKNKKIEYSWEGLTKKQISFLKKYKKSIRIKEGIAFIPAFLIAFLIYLFKEEILSFMFSFA